MQEQPTGSEETGTDAGTSARLRLGCSLASIALLALVLVAALAVALRLPALRALGGETSTLAIDDDTSPERLSAYLDEDRARLTTFGWVDEEQEIAHVPIDEAMALLLEEGIPVGVAPAREPAGEAGAEEGQAPIDPATVSFQGDVLPIFEARCGECHGEDDPEEGLQLTTHRTALLGSIYGSVIVPGDVEGSYLVEQIVSGKMPKRDDPLSPRQIETIIAWIEAGAPDN